MNTSLLFLISICFIAMVSPGPDFILVTKNALLYPKKLALATAFGIVTGSLFHASYCILGLALIITQSTLAYSIIKYLGAAYLIYLGLKGLGSQKIQAIQPDSHSEKNKTVLNAYMEGLLCNALNPKLAVFLLSLFTQFVAVDASISDKLLVTAVFVGESMLYWPLLVLFLQTHNIRKFFNHAQITMNRVFGALLICLGLRVLLSSD